MGGIYSDGLEHADPEVVQVKYSDLVAEALHDGKYHLAEQYLDELAVVKPMVETYVAHVMIPNVKREIEFVGMSAHGFQDNGRLDGMLDPDEDNLVEFIENKLKGRWGRAEAAALALDDQLTSYFVNLQAMFSLEAGQLKARYEVAKKPQLRQNKSETREAFRARVTADILSRPDHYHWISDPIYRSQDQLDEWKVLFERMARDIRHEHELESEGDESAWPKNPDACSDYGGCSMAPICWAPNEDEAVHVIQTQFKTHTPEGQA